MKRGLGKYRLPGAREIIHTSLLYHDGKIQLPKVVVDFLRLTRGRDRIVWILEDNRIYVESAVQTR